MLLTIGLPVYNGEKYIKDAVESILNCDFDVNEVEIIVCDNASTDQTVNIIMGLGNSNVKILEHVENIGFDGNVNRIFNYAKGKYVWAIGADDLIVPNQIDSLLATLRSHEDFGVVFVGGYKKTPEIYSVFEQAEAFLIESNFRSGFFPNNIIAKLLWSSCQVDPFIGSGWIHYAVILQALRKSKSAITRDSFIIENPKANELKVWNNNGAGILVGLKLVEIFQVMENWNYDKKFIVRIKRIIKDSYPREIIVAKLRGLKVSRSLLLIFIKSYREYPLFWIVDLWFLLIPSFIYRIVAFPLKYANVLK